MFGADVFAFSEFMVREPVPLSAVHRLLLEFLQERDDAVVFGAQAVNAYVDEPRMTQDLDLLATNAEALAQDLAQTLRSRLRIAVRVRRLADGSAFRVFQVRKEGNRHLVNIRNVEALPPAQRISGVLVLAPPALIASKVIAWHRRRGQPKSGTDWRDLAMLLLRFPELKSVDGPVADQLRLRGVSEDELVAWREFVQQNILPASEDDGY